MLFGVLASFPDVPDAPAAAPEFVDVVLSLTNLMLFDRHT